MNQGRRAVLLGISTIAGAISAAAAAEPVPPGAPMPHVQEVERRLIDAAYPVQYLAAPATRGPCESWSATGEAARRASEAIRLVERGSLPVARTLLLSYLDSSGAGHLRGQIEAAARPGGSTSSPPNEDVEGLLLALYVAGSVEAGSGETRAVMAGRGHLAQALVCARALLYRGQITAMEPQATRDALPIKFSGCGGASEADLSVYDLYNNQLTADLVEPVEHGAAAPGQGAQRETALQPVLLRLESEPALAAQAPTAALRDAERLLRWAWRPSPVLACNLATLLSRAEALAPAAALEELRRKREELAAAARAQLAGTPETGIAVSLTRLELLRASESRTAPALPDSWPSKLGEGQRQALAAVRFSLEKSRSSEQLDTVEPAQAAALLGTESSPWLKAVRMDTVPPFWVVAWTAGARQARETWEAHRMKILIGGGGALALAALYVLGRWTLIQLRHRSALLTSFYRRETEELLRRTRSRR
jgi:hypothetical protein